MDSRQIYPPRLPDFIDTERSLRWGTVEYLKKTKKGLPRHCFESPTMRAETFSSLELFHYRLEAVQHSSLMRSSLIVV